MQSVFEALAHPIRRDILKMLRQQAMSAGEIADHFPIAKPTLSGHFTVLKNADLITAERKGTTILYRINESVLEQMLGAVMSLAAVGEAAKDKETAPWTKPKQAKR
jgi:ArsR family transcriptional regulator, arsenate/arsenite/antimonite-responsive transcriptional repressor